MPHGPPHFGTEIIEPRRPPTEAEQTPQEKCRASGGTWDTQTKTCIFPAPKAAEPPKEDESRVQGETIQSTGTARPGTTPAFRTTIQGDRFDVNLPVSSESFSSIESFEQAKKIKELEGAGGFSDQGELGRNISVIEAERRQAEGQRLAGGIGQFEQLGVDPTGLNVGEAITTGLVSAVPRALTLAGGAAVAGATAGLATGGVLSAPLAAAAAAVTFIGSLASSMISNFKAQRTDTTTAQQRTLDEGKQTMQDWATAAAADPTNRARYLSEYNKQAALIDQAYRQMKLDTSRDLAKFETALPNLAEFESFYSSGGERDVLNADMQLGLIGGMSQQTIDFRMLELTNRRKE